MWELDVATAERGLPVSAGLLATTQHVHNTDRHTDGFNDTNKIILLFVLTAELLLLSPN